MGLIYKATNKINGKSYIGQTQTSLNDRISKHFYSVRHNSNLHFHNALRKYDFDWTIIEKCKSKVELDKKECCYIEQYNTFDDGYNLTKGGDAGTFGHKHSKETKKKMSKIAKKRLEIPENHNFYGKHHSEKTKEKIRNSKLGQKVHSEEWKKDLGKRMSGSNNPMYKKPTYGFKGKKHSEESLQKMRKASSGKNCSEKTRKKMSEAKILWWKKRREDVTTSVT